MKFLILALFLSTNAQAVWYGLLCNESNGKQILYHYENNRSGVGEGVCFDEKIDGKLTSDAISGYADIVVDAPTGIKSLVLNPTKKATVDQKTADDAAKASADLTEKTMFQVLRAKFLAGTETAADRTAILKYILKRIND